MLLSDIKEIEDIRFQKVLRRPAKAQAMVVVDGMTIVKLGEKKVYCSWRLPTNYALCPGQYRGCVQNLLNGLVLLKMLPKEAAERHMELARKADARQDFDYDRKRLAELAEKYGFKAPAIKIEK